MSEFSEPKTKDNHYWKNMLPKKEDFNFNKFWGSDLLKPFVEYSRKGVYYCIYCGAQADTREHVPSKTFLNKPLPSDLPVLPACQRCNNGFSSDELYVKTYIMCLKEVLENRNYSCLQIEPTERKEIREAKSTVKEVADTRILTYDKRVGRVLLKLAIGHAVYELSESYHSIKWNGTPIYIKYTVKSTDSEKEWNNLEYAETMNAKILPEIGSRVFRNLLVLQTPLISDEKDKYANLNLVIMNWTDIQDGVYRYIAYLDDDKLVVKMVILDYLYGEVVFQKHNLENIAT